MYLSQLNIIQFKNIDSLSLQFDCRFNCFVGANGAGKTNILDAIHCLSFGKSAFSLSDGQTVSHNKDFFLLEGCYQTESDSIESVSYGFKKGGAKKLRRNEKEYGKISDHIGLIPLVMISPADTGIINESGEERRRYLNALISQTDKHYLGDLIRYNQLLSQRNNLLKDLGGAQQREILEIIDLQLSDIGDRIHAKRKSMIEKLTPAVAEYYSTLSGDTEQVSMEYQSKVTDKGMEALLKESLDKDIANRYSTSGVHRDDIRMEIMGYPIRKYGSQGQQKSFIIALKLAQSAVLSQQTGITPLLLLDDVFDKLDAQRVEKLISIVSAPTFGQIFFTDCNPLRLETILRQSKLPHSVFRVEKGEIHTPDSSTTLCNEENRCL